MWKREREREREREEDKWSKRERQREERGERGSKNVLVYLCVCVLVCVCVCLCVCVQVTTWLENQNFSEAYPVHSIHTPEVFVFLVHFFIDFSSRRNLGTRYTRPRFLFSIPQIAGYAAHQGPHTHIHVCVCVCVYIHTHLKIWTD